MDWYSTDLQELFKAKRVAYETIDPKVVRQVSAIERAYPVQELMAVEQAVNSALALSTIRKLESINQAAQIVQQVCQIIPPLTLFEFQDSINSALQQIDSPSIQADIKTVQSTSRKSRARSVSSLPAPEDRIIDALVWDDGEWYRQKARETATNIVDYSFYKANQAGELTDATDREVGAGSFAAVLLVTLLLTGNPLLSLTAASASGVGSKMVWGGARDRAERKNLGDKFGE